MRVPVGVTCSAVVLCAFAAVGAGWQTIEADRRIDALSVELRAADASLVEASADQQRAVAERATSQARVDERAAVLAERPAFVQAVADARSVIGGAGDVDVASARDEIVAAQDEVLGERRDPQVIRDATAAVTVAAASARDAIAEAEAAAAAARLASVGRASAFTGAGSSTPAASATAGGSGDWMSDLEGRLRGVGGGGVALREDAGECGGALACSSSAGVVYVNARLAGASSFTKSWAVAHELGHVKMASRWQEVATTSGFGRLFGHDHEAFANCAAAYAGYDTSGCGGAQLAWAGDLWSGRPLS